MRKINYKTIDEYIASFPDEIQERLNLIRNIIKANVPNDAVEAISYQIPCFKLNGSFIIYFAAFKMHTSIYPIPKGHESFQKEIAPYVASKGTLKFPFNKDIPIKLIKKIVIFSVEENRNRKNFY